MVEAVRQAQVTTNRDARSPNDEHALASDSERATLARRARARQTRQPKRDDGGDVFGALSKTRLRVSVTRAEGARGTRLVPASSALDAELATRIECAPAKPMGHDSGAHVALPRTNEARGEEPCSSRTALLRAARTLLCTCTKPFSPALKPWGISAKCRAVTSCSSTKHAATKLAA